MLLMLDCIIYAASGDDSADDFESCRSRSRKFYVAMLVLHA